MWSQNKISFVPKMKNDLWFVNEWNIWSRYADSNYITGVQNKATTVFLFIICKPIIFAFAKLKDA